MTHLGCLLSLWFFAAFDNVAALRHVRLNEEPETARKETGSKPAVAIMIVGRLLDTMNNQARFSQTGFSIFSVLTGSDAPMDSVKVPEFSKSNTQDDVWGNFKDNVITPLKETYGYDVDIFLCVDKVVGEVPAGVKVSTFTPTYNLGMQKQQSRWNECAQKHIGDKSKYEWVIKTRPDFFYYRPLPDLRELNKDYMYTRFRSSKNIADLTSDHISWRSCNSHCFWERIDYGIANDTMGYVNDDMVFVVPNSLIPHVFYDVARDRQSAPKALASVIDHSESGLEESRIMPEQLWRKYLCDHGVLTMPLAVAGYPRHDVAKHKLTTQDCATAPVQKKCGRGAKDISELHQTMMERYNKGLDMC